MFSRIVNGVLDWCAPVPVATKVTRSSLELTFETVLFNTLTSAFPMSVPRTVTVTGVPHGGDCGDAVNDSMRPRRSTAR